MYNKRAFFSMPTGGFGKSASSPMKGLYLRLVVSRVDVAFAIMKACNPCFLCNSAKLTGTSLMTILCVLRNRDDRCIGLEEVYMLDVGLF